jgi:hypothetical protein
LETQKNALQMLLSKIEFLENYVLAVQSRTIEPDFSTLRQIKTLCNQFQSLYQVDVHQELVQVSLFPGVFLNFS